MVRSGEILVFRHDHLSFAYEGLTFGTFFCRTFDSLFFFFLPGPTFSVCHFFDDLAV